MKLVIVGALGRMGRMLMREIAATQGVGLAGITVRPGDEGTARGALAALGLSEDVRITPHLQDILPHTEGVIDFTNPACSLEVAEATAALGKIHICGTTGFSDQELNALAKHAEKTPLLLAPNMSVGVTLLLSLVQQAAAALEETYDIEIVEMHHRHKLDAPSGTALALGEAASAGRGVVLEDTAIYERYGIGEARPEGAIGFATLRGGDVVGEHRVVFAGPGERVELTHKATDRSIFARGAIKAALWARRQPPGLYSMQDVLGMTD